MDDPTTRLADPGGVGHPDEARLRQLAATWRQEGNQSKADAAIFQREGKDWRDVLTMSARGACFLRVADALEALLVRQPVPPPGAVPAAQACEGGVTVRWCPRCGTCTCPPQHGNPDRWVEDPHCPIHGNRSTHDEPAAVPAAQDAGACKRHGDPLVCLACEQEEDSRPEWQQVTPPIHRVTPPRLSGEPERPNESVVHRCSGCGHRWHARLTTAELCGDCWRKAQPHLLHGSVPAAQDSPKVICLCGSTRFIEQFATATWILERQGYIVLGCTLLPLWFCECASHFGEKSGTKEQCDEHHKRKIDLADEVFVLDIGGYIGESTRSEIAYAEAHGKTMRYVSREPDLLLAILPASHPSRQEPPHE